MTGTQRDRMISLFTSKLEEIDLGTFLSRADVARMRQIWLSSCYPLSIRGGISAFKYISYMYFSHCVLLSTLTYAPSPTPLITCHLTHTSLIITQVHGMFPTTGEETSSPNSEKPTILCGDLPHYSWIRL